MKVPTDSTDLVGTTLLCPVCGGENLHQGRTEVYERCEDDKHCLRTVIEDGLASTEISDNRSNPSSRRHGMRIWFYCEGCDEDTPPKALEIIQHKGCTYIYWEGI